MNLLRVFTVLVAAFPYRTAFATTGDALHAGVKLLSNDEIKAGFLADGWKVVDQIISPNGKHRGFTAESLNATILGNGKVSMKIGSIIHFTLLHVCVL